MDQKRFLLFVVVSMGILIGWNVFVMPRFLPPPKPKGAQNQPDRKADDEAQKPKLADKGPEAGAGRDDGEEAPGKNAQAEEADPEAALHKPPAGEPGAAREPGNEDVRKDNPRAPQFPEKTAQLGSDEFLTGYRQLVTLTSKGAAVQTIQLNDPRYRKLVKDAKGVHPPLVVLGEDDVEPLTFELVVPQVKAEIDKLNIDKLNWELVELTPAEGPHSVAVFKLQVDGLEIIKRYELPTIDPKAEQPEAPAYAMKVAVTFRNVAKQARTVNYILQGPTGLPLENVENTQKFRDIVVGFVGDGGTVANELMSAKTVAADKVEKWNRPVKYIGTDVQFFAALLCPVDDQRQAPYTKIIQQQLIGPKKEEKSDISVLLTSVDVQLEGAGDADGKDAVTHAYRLFAGPKRDDVLLAYGAEKVIDFGWFHWISRPMLSLLKVFHRISGSWGIAIICLTIVVRSAMFPISIRQARSAAVMQALKPEMAALDQKYANDKEKLARAKMELFRKHGHNPFAGCLPLFLQLPIFMGLYQALNHAVDLRMASFLYIDNLAAPDALFRLPFNLPFLGQDFNLLPVITTGLFYVQQKMFMPPPTNEQEAMQQKMMSFMMIFMGVMFYKVPAGLCVYFVASSMWGMAERKLLPKPKPPTAAEPPVDPPQGRRKSPGPDDNDQGGGGLWAMLLRAAEKETSAKRSSSDRRK